MKGVYSFFFFLRQKTFQYSFCMCSVRIKEFNTLFLAKKLSNILLYIFYVLVKLESMEDNDIDYTTIINLNQLLGADQA